MPNNTVDPNHPDIVWDAAPSQAVVQMPGAVPTSMNSVGNIGGGPEARLNPTDDQIRWNEPKAQEGAKAGAIAAFIDSMGKHIGVPGTNIDLLHAANRISGAMGGNTATDEEDAASAEASPTASTLGSMAGGTIGLGAAGTAIGAASKGAQAAWQARKLAILQQQAAKINAMQDAAQIQKIAEAVSPKVWGSGVGQKVSQFLKDDAEASLTPKTSGAGGGPQWDVPGQLPKGAPDVTPAALARQAAERTASQSTRTLLKNPAFWYAVTGASALGGGGVWGAMSTTYHARQLFRNLSRIFGE